LEPLLKII